MKNVQVTVNADWAGEPVRAPNVSFPVMVEVDASEKGIHDLIRHTDDVGEGPNSLRLRTEVRLRKQEPS